jgi:hypothetical protein
MARRREEVLEKAARNTPFSKTEKMWEALDACVPNAPVEIRARIKSVGWKDGVAKISIDTPLGWPERTRINSPVPCCTRTFHVTISEQKAAKLPGSWFICTSRWVLFRDYAELLKTRDTFVD